jgi:phosphoribosylamine--glycine ligase
MNIVVVGSGGREHALVRALARTSGISVTCAPGNAGIARDARLDAVDLRDPEAILALARRHDADLTVIGPELPLECGVADHFHAHGMRIFGPSRAAAQLECSKAFAKDFMSRHGIPTARYRVCDTAAAAHDIVERAEMGLPVVIKADGLAAGKGVIVAADREEAHAAVRTMMEDQQFGSAGARVIIEECLSGPEVSFFAICDGTVAVPVGSAQDHKRIFDGDRGPNTGGMGAFAPSPLMDAALEARVMREIVEPVMRGMRSDGREYRGFLYAGLMLTCKGPHVIEFNVRFGDPEAQVVLPLIEGDLVSTLIAAADGSVGASRVSLSTDVTVGVVLASGGYPGPIIDGRHIEGIEAAEALSGVEVYHAATAERSGQLVTSGGRVLTVVGRAATFDAAIERAYAGVSRIAFEGMQYRRDIGQKAKTQRV